MVKKRNKRGIGLVTVQKHREKLKQIYKKLGRPRLPKHLLDLNETSLQEEPAAEIPRLKVITAGRNLESDIFKNSRWMVNVPICLKSYEELVIKHM